MKSRGRVADRHDLNEALSRTRNSVTVLEHVPDSLQRYFVIIPITAQLRAVYGCGTFAAIAHLAWDRVRWWIGDRLWTVLHPIDAAEIRRQIREEA